MSDTEQEKEKKTIKSTTDKTTTKKTDSKVKRIEKKVKEVGQDVKETAAKATAKVTEKTKEVVKKTAELADRATDKAVEGAEKIEDNVKKVSEKLSEVIENVVEKTKDTLKKVAKVHRKNILFACSEAYPFAGTGGLGEVIGSLPSAINQESKEYNASIILPLYESFPFEEREKLEFVCNINVPLAWRNQYCGLFKYKHNGVTYYFVDNEYYFKRPNLYGYYDDGERFAFLARAIVELIPYLDAKPDVIHCHDWQTALVPIYYKLFYMYRQGYDNIKVIFTIHNIEYQGKYSKNIIEDVFGIPEKEFISLEHGGAINLMKGAIDYADAISTVSPSYAQEIMDPYYAHGLHGVLLKNSFKLRGILNGVDTLSYDPETNPALFKNYTVKNVKEGKAENKAELQKMFSLPIRPDVPMVAMITRLVEHKGLDLVRQAMEEVLSKDVQFIVLGKGDIDYENLMSHLQQIHPEKFFSVIAFNRDLSHKMYAAADMFLMPSKSEPCGLSQMMACRYGTVPIVRATGGLRDSIHDCGDGDDGNGFVFNNYDAQDMMNAVDRAVGLYYDYHDKWDGLVKRCMTTDFTWGQSAKEYIKFYREFF